MDYEIIQLKEKIVAGITAPTNNHAADVSQVIGNLWNRFYQEIYGNIPDQADERVIGLYTDYTGNADDDYTAMVCCAVTKVAKSTQYDIRKIPAGRYAKFQIFCDTHTSVAQVTRAWQEIWKMDLPRAFICDFEEYQSNAMGQSKIYLYIGLKEGSK